MLIPITAVISFLQDEQLGPIKIKKDDKYAFEIYLNEPADWGTQDTKYRCGITSKISIGNNGNIQQVILFNAFKAKAVLGDEYSGTFFQFVKLVKKFNSQTTARKYFLEKYVLQLSDLSILNEQQLQHTIIPTDKKIIAHSVYLPHEYEKFNFDIHKEYTEYLLSRGVSEEKIKNIKLFINPIEKRIVFPIYENGVLVFYIERDITDINPIRWKKSKSKNIYPIWNLENVQGTTLYIFEGIFDAIHFQNGVALLGVGSEHQFDKIIKKGFSKIVLFFDNDKAGRNARYKWAKWLTSRNINNVYIFNYVGIKEKDFSEICKKNNNIQINERFILWNDVAEIKFKLGIIQ